MDLRTRRAMLPALVAAGYVLNVLWRIWVSWPVTNPILLSDEFTYLLTARAISGGPGGESGESPSFLRVGYSILIAPCFWLSDDPAVVFRGVQIVNAVVNAAVFPLAYLFGKRVFALDRLTAYLAALVAAALPAVVYYSPMAMQDVPLAPLLLVWALGLHAWIRGKTMTAAIIAGTAAGGIFLIHIRGSVVVAVHIVLILVLLLRRQVAVKAALASLATMTALGVVNYAVHAAIADKLTVVGELPTQNSVLSQLLTVNGLLTDLNAVTNELWYLSVVTAGLAAVGFALVVADLWRRPRTYPARTWVLLAVFLAMTGIAASSSAVLLFSGEGRMNFYTYIRYIHCFTPIWLMAGVAAVRLSRARTARLLMLAAGVGVTLAGIAFAVRLAFRGTRSVFIRFDAPEMTLLPGGANNFPVWTATAVALLGLALAYLLLRKRRWRPAFLGLLLALNLVAGYQLTATVLVPWMQPVIPAVTLESLGVGPDDTVYRELCDPYTPRRNHEFQVYWHRLLPFEGVPPEDADVVVACWQPGGQAHWPGEALGFQHIGGDPARGWAVWRAH